ncbi:MAG TPA: tRNA (adenosine(37)-N6)-threonylcarbamoyltransferase complex ATPase subunit type 1 TsaE [Candidatus Paceibacterota bacterium]|nr:tRNA (adenosine(37)-N6)-threonylcarbamoyltransferase complex ATPase subunit type 1 TsaE [Candidatus Paceibacterota bacterium]
MEIRVGSAIELQEEAARFASRIVPHASAATIIALSGELGAGKTTFTQGIAKALGVDESVTSPTFVIEKIYALHDQKFARLIHVDAYRLESAHELEVLGWHEIASDAANLILIEWPEKVATLIPEGAIRIRFDIAGEGRIISINGVEENNT